MSLPILFISRASPEDIFQHPHFIPPLSFEIATAHDYVLLT